MKGSIVEEFMDVYFPEGMKVNANYKGFTIETDQS